MIVQFFVELLTGVRWKVESSAVAHKLYHIARAIEDSAAVRAVPKVRGQNGAQLRIYFVVEIV